MRVLSILIAMMFISLSANAALQIQLLSKAAESGQPQAQFDLAEKYSSGDEIAQNLKLAAEWYEKAAEQNLPQAQYALAHCYAEGLGVEQDHALAIHWLNRAVQLYHPPAQYKIGLCFEKGALGLKKDPAKAVKWARSAASQEYAPAYTMLGRYYLNGFGVKADLPAAIKWFQRGAKGGDQESIQIIAEHFDEWQDYLNDATPGLDYVATKANAGDLESQLVLADYYRSNADEDSQVKAVEWLTKAADQGSAEAVALLIEHYESGKGIEQDIGMAMDYCRSLAEEGEVQYQEKLAKLYAEPGTLQNLNESLVWYLKAAKQGSMSAQIKCIFIYGKGTGVTRNRVEAYAWSMVVGHNGNKAYQNSLEPILSMEEKMQGMRRFRAILKELK